MILTSKVSYWTQESFREPARAELPSMQRIVTGMKNTLEDN